MKLMNKRIISLLLALVMLCSMMPGFTINAFAAEQTATNELEGKTISILGASMSTYTGISNNPDYNSTIGNNAVYYTEGKLGVYKNDTWWMQVANDLGLRLLVNNSWSGSSLLHERNGTVGAYVDRCVQLHNNEGEAPDIIAIQMGTNDFQYYKDTLGTADIDYTALITENEDGSYTYAEPTTSLEAAAIVLHKISIRYPDAEVYYLNISQRIDGTDELIRSFNAELKQVVEHFGAHIVDIYGSAITMADFDTYIGDGRVHPNCLGMDAYTEAFKRALLANTTYDVDTHTVSFDLDGVMADYGDDKIVVSGDAFSCKLTAEDGKELSVSVAMGGRDITDTTYENGTVSIGSVTDDVVITAEATVHKSQNYRWEFDGTDLSCVSGGNTLTKDSGTTTDGVFSKTSYTLESEVVLMHDLPWIVEWKCKGTFLNTNGSSGARIFTSDNVNANYNARYIFKSNTNGIIAMGEKDTKGSHNYGIALADYGIDWTALHTYRLENRIADDGSNMVWLLVDGKEIGPMNHYYIGTKDQNTASDWLSGKDFVFPYMGTDTHGFTNASIDYIQVWEGGHTHTYENGTCTGCGATVSPYLQQLPENVIGCTNLYDSLVPVKGYYTATKYDTSNGAVISVVIPVEPGDQIAASSFGSVSENMGSVNGVRVTYLLGDKIVTSLSAGDVYTGYTNNGYITVPDGVDAVSIPWWVPNENNWLTLSQISKGYAVHSPKPISAQAPTCTENGYTAGEICEVCNASLGEREAIPPTGHAYSGDTCTICGAVNLESILSGKYVSILGDSISTFNGYSNDATGNTTIGGNGPRYDAGTADTKPGSYCLLESVDQTWWMHFANRSGMKLLVNNSWAGSQVFGGQTSDGRVIPAAYLDRCLNLHDNTLENNPGNAPINPDVIFVYLGINDYNFNRSKVGTGAVDYAGLVSSDGTYVTPTTFGEAYGIMLHKMRDAYPNAQIFAMTLLPENLYSVDKTAWEQHNAYIRGAAEYYDIPVVDLAENCAITWENFSGYMIDKIHPTTAGMQLISDCIEAELVSYYKENPPHTHTYEFTITAPTCTEQGYTTYTCVCGDNYVDDYTESIGHSYVNTICAACGVKEWDTDGDGVLEILAIGNSFSVDALEYAYQIAHNLGIEEIVIGNLYIGGCTLATHAANAAGDLGKYTYYYNDNGTWTSTGSYKISTALESRSWDYVSMQQGSPVSGVESSYNEDLTNLISYVKERSDAKLVWHMTWAYQQNSTHSAFPTYGKDQMTMYNAIVSAVQNKIVTNENFDLIVPNGTAVQNSRTSLLGDTTTRDGYHMSYDYGRYLTGLLFVKTLTGLDISNVTYAPSGVDAEEKAIAIESANNAAAKSFEVTKSKNVNEVPEEGHLLLQTPIYQGAFWHPLKVGRYNELIDDQSNSPDFFTTIRFTRETLPVGAIIVLESGWQYRPDGWVTDTLQTGARESATTKAFQIVTEEWWKDYTIRSFNISRTTGGSVMNLTEEEMRSIFRIYVPEEKHTHTYSNGICTGCGAAQPGPVITQQPTDGEAKMGERYIVEVKAEGDGLKYQWYFRNSGSTVWYKSGVKDNTYDDEMTTARAGREIYCVITDANGNSVKTDTVKLICIPSEELAITKQPTDGEAVLGERYCVTVEAKGEGLKYQWYFRNKGANHWTTSSVRDNTYDDVMTTTRDGREVYCVITDLAGNEVTTDTVKLVRVPMKLEIVTQPTDATAPFGEMFCATVEARGEGLKYQWYYRNAGGLIWYKSGVRDNTYDDVMTKARNGREVYCVITDKYGNSVTTDTVKLIAVPSVELKLLGQSYESAAMGEKYCVTVNVQGEGLKYQWYFRNAGATRWSKSGVHDNTYDDVMNRTRANREVYCVITDAFGNQIITEVVTLTVEK